MKAFALHCSYDFSAGLRNRTLLLMNYLMPLGFYGLVGGMMTQINPYFGDQLIPAMVIFAVLSGAILGLPGPLVEAREAKILRSYKVHGISAGSLLAVPTISSALHMMLVGTIITVTAPIFFGSPLPTNWPSYLLVFSLFLFASSGLASLVGVIANNSRSSVLWQQLIYLPSILLGGLMVPADTLPQAFAKLGHLLPASYAMQAFNGLAYGRDALYQPGLALAFLFVGGILAYGLAFYLFSWDNENSSRRAHPAFAALVLLPYAIGALTLF